MHIKFLPILTMSVALGVSCGCQGYRDTVRGMGHSMGAIEPRDIQQADAYRQALPGHLGLSADQVVVEPGSGETNVTISGVGSDSEQQRISSALESLNAQNPQLNPLKWSFK